MRSYGAATAFVGGREPVPLPAEPAKIGRRVQLVDCGRGHRIRPGAFHICLDLATPEPPPPVVKKPKPKPEREPRPRARRDTQPRRKPGRPRIEREVPICRNECGRTVSVPGNQCRPCSNAARAAARPKREPKPRDRREDALCAAGCGEKVYKAGNRCRTCSAAARVKPKPPPKPRVKKDQPTCRNDGCDRPVAKDGNRCRPCYVATTAAAQKRERVGRGLGGGRHNHGGKVNARIDEIMERYLAGESTKALAADVGVTPNGIRFALKRRGVKIRSQAEEQRGRLRPDLRALTPEQVAEVAARYQMGASVTGIALRLGVGETTVRRALSDSGVKPHGRRGPR